VGTQLWAEYNIWRSILDILGDEKLNGGGWCHGVIRPWDACQRGISCLVRLQGMQKVQDQGAGVQK
jgi:hypothetical protein